MSTNKSIKKIREQDKDDKIIAQVQSNKEDWQKDLNELCKRYESSFKKSPVYIKASRDCFNSLDTNIMKSLLEKKNYNFGQHKLKISVTGNSKDNTIELCGEDKEFLMKLVKLKNNK